MNAPNLDTLLFTGLRGEELSKRVKGEPVSLGVDDLEWRALVDIHDANTRISAARCEMHAVWSPGQIGNALMVTPDFLRLPVLSQEKLLLDGLFG